MDTSRSIDERVVAIDVGLTEGPVFLRNGTLITVSSDRGHVLRYDETGPSIFAITGTGPNGLAEGADGSVYVTMGGRVGKRPRDGTPVGILGIRPNGRLQWVTQDPVGPNDLCFGPDGWLYVTDPTRGRRDDGRIWRVDVATGHSELLVSVGWYPNGIGFGADDSVLYVADTTNGKMVRFGLKSDGLGAPETAFELDHGVPDGFAFDTEGNVIIATQSREFANPGAGELGRGDRGDVQTYSATGSLLDVFQPSVSKHYTNVALNARRQLVVTSAGDTSMIASGRETGGAVIAVDSWPTAGLPLHPFR
jgi:gluconolactonase